MKKKYCTPKICAPIQLFMCLKLDDSIGVITLTAMLVQAFETWEMPMSKTTPTPVSFEKTMLLTLSSIMYSFCDIVFCLLK